MARAAFLDRDGTINEKPAEGSYVESWDGFRFLPGARDALRLLHEDGWLVIVVTNQRGVALGRMTLADVDEIHRRLRRLAPIDAVYVCPHEGDSCRCRKPDTGMFEDALRDFPGIDLAASVVIGDAPSDIEAGRRLGCRTVLVGPPPLPSLRDVALGLR